MIADYSEFIALIRSGDRSGSLEWAMSRLKDGRIDVLRLYRDVLAPTLGEKDCSDDDLGCIFNEHLRSSIIRTIVENAYPLVIKEKRERFGDVKGKKVLVTSPSEEYHDLATRMAADLFSLAGFEAMFLGSNTPANVVADAIEKYGPDIVSFSVMNYYHIPTAAREIKDIRARFGEKPLIVVGGSAFERNPDAGKGIGADKVLLNFKDIQDLAKGV